MEPQTINLKQILRLLPIVILLTNRRRNTLLPSLFLPPFFFISIIIIVIRIERKLSLFVHFFVHFFAKHLLISMKILLHIVVSHQGIHVHVEPHAHSHVHIHIHEVVLLKAVEEHRLILHPHEFLVHFLHFRSVFLVCELALKGFWGLVGLFQFYGAVGVLGKVSFEVVLAGEFGEDGAQIAGLEGNFFFLKRVYGGLYSGRVELSIDWILS